MDRNDMNKLSVYATGSIFLARISGGGEGKHRRTETNGSGDGQLNPDHRGKAEAGGSSRHQDKDRICRGVLRRNRGKIHT